jgi:predicted DNA binding CopG/RHH family protein
MKKEYNLKALKKRPGKAKVDSEATKVPISLRVDGGVLASLKTEAERLGLPYQTFIGSILHQYATGELVSKKLVETLKEIQAS